MEIKGNTSKLSDPEIIESKMIEANKKPIDSRQPAIEVIGNKGLVGLHNNKMGG